MTFKEFKNLKVNDIIYSWDSDIEDAIEHKIDSIDYYKIEFYSDGCFYDKRFLKDLYNNRSKCKIENIQKTIKFYTLSIEDNNKQILSLQKEIKDYQNRLDVLYKNNDEFIKENLQHFI